MSDCLIHKFYDLTLFLLLERNFSKQYITNHNSVFHSSILRVFALKFTPILNNWRGSEAKGSA